MSNRHTKHRNTARKPRSPLVLALLVMLVLVVVGLIVGAGVVMTGAFLPPKPTYLIRTLENSTLTNTPTITPFPATLMTVQGPTMRIRTVAPTPEIPQTLIPLARSAEPTYTPKNQR